jgi:hypothetical protein
MLFSITRSARELKVSSETDDLKRVLKVLGLEKLLSTPAKETGMVNKILFKNIIQGTGLRCLIYSLNFKYLLARNV